MSRFRRRARAGHGYTLIELVIVLAVLAVATAVAVPAVGNAMEGLRARAEVAGLAALLRAAHEQAVERRSTYEVVFEPAARLARLAPAGDASVRQVSVVRRFSPLLRLGGDGVATTTRITFLPEGTSTGGQVQVDGPGGRRYRITVDALTGRVSTQQVGS